MLKKFLKKYDTLIFDMDGVMTSEQNYWNCAALTVYEFLNSNKYFGKKDIDIEFMSENVENIRNEIFIDDRLIKILKEKGVNSNWDLSYVTLILYIISDGEQEKIFSAVDGMRANILDEYERLSCMLCEKTSKSREYTQRNGILWNEMFTCFQEWFLGYELYQEAYGKESMSKNKQGLIYREEPLVDLEKLKLLLSRLKAEGKRLCIGTGRPKYEIFAPLEQWGILDYFDTDARITFDYVIEAERKVGGITLTKPHPYVFLKALYGADYDDIKLFEGEYDKSKILKTLVIGDAGADIFAAQAMGADFCAVLTGVAGESARDYFEKTDADYILNSVLDLIN